MAMYKRCLLFVLFVAFFVKVGAIQQAQAQVQVIPIEGNLSIRSFEPLNVNTEQGMIIIESDSGFIMVYPPSFIAQNVDLDEESTAASVLAALYPTLYDGEEIDPAFIYDGFMSNHDIAAYGAGAHDWLLNLGDGTFLLYRYPAQEPGFVEQAQMLLFSLNLTPTTRFFSNDDDLTEFAQFSASLESGEMEFGEMESDMPAEEGESTVIELDDTFAMISLEALDVMDGEDGSIEVGMETGSILIFPPSLVAEYVELDEDSTALSVLGGLYMTLYESELDEEWTYEGLLSDYDTAVTYYEEEDSAGVTWVIYLGDDQFLMYDYYASVEDFADHGIAADVLMFSLLDGSEFTDVFTEDNFSELAEFHEMLNAEIANQ